jgi:4-hydroxy-3-methylbut-2-enyl diphosphate reductase
MNDTARANSAAPSAPVQAVRPVTDGGPGTLEVIVAQSAGTCFGVEAAIELANEKRKPILGPLVHNPQVVGQLAAAGIPILERYRDLKPEDGISEVVITAHGYPKPLKEELRAKGIAYHDATCPILLRWVYRKIERFEAEGCHIFLIGNPDHAEIIASRTYGSNITVVYSDEDVDKIPAGLGQTVAICQTTITREKFQHLVDAIRARKYPDVKAVDTRCKPVRNQQEAVESLAQWVDAMVIIGGYDSSNTTNLAKLARKFLPQRTHHVDSPGKVTLEMIAGARSVGIGAGTSTPKSQIEDTKRRIADIFPGTVLFRDAPGDGDELSDLRDES